MRYIGYRKMIPRYVRYAISFFMGCSAIWFIWFMRFHALLHGNSCGDLVHSNGESSMINTTSANGVFRISRFYILASSIGNGMQHDSGFVTFIFVRVHAWLLDTFTLHAWYRSDTYTHDRWYSVGYAAAANYATSVSMAQNAQKQGKNPLLRPLIFLR
jgi:hypothetical protein